MPGKPAQWKAFSLELPRLRYRVGRKIASALDSRSMSMDIFDFVVVGAGASGCVVASRLARSAARPAVLLLEAGGDSRTSGDKSGAERFNEAFKPSSPLNWNYRTTSQTQLDGQTIDYSRGRGLGGSTAINFCGWTVGPSGDWDELAAIVQDDRFGWQNVQRCLQRIERVHPLIPNEALERYVKANMQMHSTSGALDLTYGNLWDPNVGELFVAAEQAGLPLNSDVNSGDPIGMGMGTVCIHKGRRLTAASAYLEKPPSNLTIVPDAMVARVLFTDDRAVGVETMEKRWYHARHEVILAAGALNTPQLLMLSGVGPAAELQRHGMDTVSDLWAVGENLQDHCFSSLGIVLDRANLDGSQSQSPSPMGWFKLPSLDDSSEALALPEGVRRHRARSTVPDFEIATHTPPSFVGHEPIAGMEFLGAICLVMNPQSRGTVRLQSRDPRQPPLVDPAFLSHKFDRRLLIEGMRTTRQLLEAPVYAAKTVKTYFPAGDSDEEIWAYIRGNLRSSWHMSGTLKMGKDGADSCVDSQFRVHGVKGLRVVDMSVVPFVPNCHTQSTAYILGEMAGDALAEEYGLSQVSRTAQPKL